METREYRHPGAESHQYNDIEPHSTFTMTGPGSVTITNIGHDSTIHFHSAGKLTIRGVIGKDVKVIHDGSGTLTFDEKPPSSLKLEGINKHDTIIKKIQSPVLMRKIRIKKI